MALVYDPEFPDDPLALTVTHIDSAILRLTALATGVRLRNEEAHLLEDAIYVGALRAVAAGHPDAAALAAAALRADTVDYDRWYS